LLDITCVYLYQYADDSQVILATCTGSINGLLSSSRLRLNASKTLVLWLGSSHQVSHTNILIPSAVIKISESAPDLGVVMDTVTQQ